MKTKSVENGTANTHCTLNLMKIAQIGAQRRRPGAPKWPRTAPGTHAPAYSAPEMDPSDLPKGSRELQEAPLDPPEAAKGSP